MNIVKTRIGTELRIQLEGRLDTVTAPELEAELNELESDITTLDLDLEALTYMSSAGLRVILGLQKLMTTQGKMVVHNVNDVIMDIFEVTGFADVLTIE